MNVGRSARAVAYAVLRRIEANGAYANLALGPALERAELAPADRRLVTDLVYGTTRMRRACDALVDRFVTVAPDPATRTLLRLGAYQLVFAGIAPHAAVSETVALAPRRTRGFVNAVLRRVASEPMTWMSDAVRLSYPDWIVDRLQRELGGEAGAALERMNAPPPVSERADGYIQDVSSQWVAAAVSVQSGGLVLDACAAPGGKATAIARSNERATVIALDRHAHRAALVRDNVAGLGLASVAVVVADATTPPARDLAFQAVLVDAPCTGLGALRRRPDARWRVEPHDVTSLVGLQRRIVAGVAPLVAPGGQLVYSVCTLTAAESIDHPVPEGFEVDVAPPPVGTWRPYGHGWRVLPQDADTDGMAMIRYRRRA